MYVYHYRCMIPIRSLWGTLSILFLCSVPQVSQAATLVALGDSFTAGYGLAQEEAFPFVLEKELREKGYELTVVNAGKSGDTTAGGVSRLAEVLAENSDGVILELGANDATRALDVDFMKSNLRAMLITFQTHSLPVLLVGMHAPLDKGPIYRARYKQTFVDLAEEFNLILYPYFFDGVELRPDLIQADGVHPNAEAVRRIVEQIGPTVETFLQEKMAVAPQNQ